MAEPFIIAENLSYTYRDGEGGGTAALRRNIPVAPYLAYLPYLLLSLFCLVLGLSLLRFRSRWLGCFCLLHGASSLAVLLFRCLKMAGLFYTGW
mgnify:CR=1 FL=1